MNKNVEFLQSALDRLNGGESTIYFLVYDTKNNPRASVKYIYDLALTLKAEGHNVKMLSEDNTYTRVSNWLGDTYNDIEILSIKEDNVQIKIDDIVVIPEYYSNILEQLNNIRCVKVLLVQQKDYIFETLPIGSRWIDFGVDRVITTTQKSKEYIMEYFPQSLVYLIPPIIGDNFKPSSTPLKPYIAISCRDRVLHRALISKFYLKYPQLRWITFKDMVQLTYEEFSDSLKECIVSLWVDNESTFGTFPLESMKCNVPVVGKVPNLEPDWISENGMWSYDDNKLVDILATYILAWLEGIELTEEVKQKMKDTLLPYDTTITKNNIISIFSSLKNGRKEMIEKSLTKLKEENV